jgi:hypothetical protein
LSKEIKICFPNDDKAEELDLISLPFKSTYRVLSWQGASDGTVLTPDFNIIDIEGKFIVIKSFKIIPYYQDASVDLFVSDGVTDNEETIPATARIDRVFDIFGSGTNIVMLINGGQVNLFNAVFPLDLDLQNIYYKYPEKVQTLQLQITALIFENINTSVTDNANLKVNMEVYLI